MKNLFIIMSISLVVFGKPKVKKQDSKTEFKVVCYDEQQGQKWERNPRSLFLAKENSFECCNDDMGAKSKIFVKNSQSNTWSQNQITNCAE